MWFNKLLKASFKENKTFSVILFCLIVISVTLIVSGFSTLSDAKNTFEKKFIEYGNGNRTLDINYGVTYGSYDETKPFPTSKDEKIIKFLDSREEIKYYYDCEKINMWRYSLVKEKDEREFYKNFGLIFCENLERKAPSILEGKKELEDNEILLSLSAKKTNKVFAEIGDCLILTYGKESIKLKVVGFYEDLEYGSELTGQKEILTNKNTLKNIAGIVERNYKEYLYDSAFVYTDQKIVLKENADGKAFLKDYCDFMNTTFGLDLSSSYDEKSIEYFASQLFMMSEILCYVLVFLGGVFFIITLFVLRYIIKATVEMTYKDIGIKKALGFKHKDISRVLMIKYLIITCLACLVSLLLSYIFVITIGRELIIRQLAFYIYGNIDFVAFIVCTVIILILMWLFSFLMLRRLKKVSPVIAVSDGKRDFYFARKIDINLKKTKVSTNLAMSLKAMCSNKGIYIAVFLIIFILTLLCGYMLELSDTMKDEEKSIQIFGLTKAELLVSYDTKKTNREDVKKELEKNENVEIAYMMNTGYCFVNDMRVRTEFSNEFDRLKTNNLLKGRNPKNENEITVGKALMNYLDLEIGDYIDFALVDNEKKKRLMIVGEFQTMMEGGFSVRVSEKLLNDEFHGEHGFVTNILFVELKDEDKMNLTKNNIKEDLEDKILGVETIGFSMNILVIIGELFDFIAILTTISSFIFIMLVMYLLTKIIISKEEKSIFSMMAMGFKRSELKLQITLRFFMIAGLACILAVPLIIFTSNLFMSLFGSVVGLVKITTPINMIIPFVLGGFILINAIIMPIISLISINNKSIMSKLNNE